jgi:Zn-dependent protease
MNNLDLTQILTWYVVLLVSLTFHEAAHALAALWGGDRTAYEGGQVSLNPWPHIRREPFGTVFLPLLMLWQTNGGSCIGFAKTPYDYLWSKRNPGKAAIMSAAGPLANFLLVAVAVVLIKIGIGIGWFEPAGYAFVRTADGSIQGPVHAAAQILRVFLLLNLFLGFLNLLPLPPLDGAGILSGLFPRTIGPLFDYLQSSFIMAIVMLILMLQFAGPLFAPIHRLAARLFM